MRGTACRAGGVPGDCGGILATNSDMRVSANAFGIARRPTRVDLHVASLDPSLARPQGGAPRAFRSGSLRAERMILLTTTLLPAITSIREL